MKVFGDTVHFIALLSTGDRWHARAVAISRESPGPLITTEWVLTEVGDAFSHPVARRKFIRLLQILREQPDVEIVRSDQDEVRLPDIERGFVGKGLPERHFPACRTRRPRRSIVRPTTVGQGGTRRPSPKFEGFGCRNYSFEAHLCGSCVHYDLPVRLHACSPPRLAATQLARSSVLNRLIAPTGLSPALTPASRARRVLRSDSCEMQPLAPPRPRHSPTPVRVLAVLGGANAKAIS
jgi:hypothetical protein